mgnify:CR=1 FL=1
MAQAQCLIRVEGTNYHSTPCNLDDETDNSVLFGHRGEDGSGYWVRIQTEEDGSFSAYWTGVE